MPRCRRPPVVLSIGSATAIRSGSARAAVAQRSRGFADWQTGRTLAGGLVKGIFDGVICAFQAHADMAVLPEVVAGLGKYLPVHPEEL